MDDDIVGRRFFSAANAWLCDGYALDIRFIASDDEAMRIWDASVALTPLPPRVDNTLRIRAQSLIIGQTQLFPATKESLVKLLSRASRGELQLPDGDLTLYGSQPHSYSYFSEMSNRDRWFSDLHLRVSGDRFPLPSSDHLAALDDELRAGTPPFDGLGDVTAWLGLSVPASMAGPPSITMRVAPPVDLIFGQCALANEHLQLTLHAHPTLDTAQVRLGVRAVPVAGLAGRRQVSQSIAWDPPLSDRRVGNAALSLPGADGVLVILMLGPSTVRRQWFFDPARARNNRLVAVQHFDADLKMVRNAVLESSDSAKFERGAASLLFILGFSPGLQIETDAPDLVVTTPGGRLLLVECTTRVADFAAKLGKLVDRRGSLARAMLASGHETPLTAVLLCRLHRNQIAAEEHLLRTHQVMLLTREDLSAAFDQVRFPSDPDLMLDTGFANLQRAKL